MRILVLVVVMCVGVVSLSAGGKQPNLPSANSGSTTGRRIAYDQTVSSAKRIPPRRVSGPIQKTVPVEGQDFVFALENRSGFGDPILQPIVMKWIPAGTFKMGSTWATDEYHLSDEEQHTVTLTQGYWMMETEVTQAMFYAVMGRRSVARSPNPKNPMEMVTWGDAYDFCREIGKNSLVMAFNNLSGFEFRLPTESEWEYACRAGTTTQVYEDYDYQYMELSEVLNVIAWWSADFPINVRQRLPNDWGLYDMLGNVAEWCSDWYDNYPSGSVTNPLGPIGGSRRVVRGGSWADNWEGLLRSAIRGSLDPVKRLEDVGFRPVLSSVR